MDAKLNVFDNVRWKVKNILSKSKTEDISKLESRPNEQLSSYESNPQYPSPPDDY